MCLGVRIEVCGFESSWLLPIFSPICITLMRFQLCTFSLITGLLIRSTNLESISVYLCDQAELTTWSMFTLLCKQTLAKLFLSWRHMCPLIRGSIIRDNVNWPHVNSLPHQTSPWDHLVFVPGINVLHQGSSSSSLDGWLVVTWLMVDCGGAVNQACYTPPSNSFSFQAQVLRGLISLFFHKIRQARSCS